VDKELFSLHGLAELAQTYAVPFAVNLALAILVFVVGRWVARVVSRIIARLLCRAHTDKSLVNFISDVAYALLFAIVVIAALERLGIRTTAAIAVLGAAGLAIGLALQGSLANFAAGVLIILLKPYRVGDTVQVAGKTGTVHAVRMFHTILHTSDMREVIVPNGAITAGVVENFSSLGTRRLEIQLGIASGEDIEETKSLVERTVGADPRVLRDPGPAVSLLELADSKVSLAVHASVRSGDFSAVQADLIEKLKALFEARLLTAKAA
jgi:small conductance mechanosensitive channel